MRRVSIVGSAGAGTTTVGRRLAAGLDVPLVELDGIFHQPEWTPLPRDEFRARVAEIVAADGWVVDGNYSAVQDLVWAAADTVVWLDPPRRVAMRRVTGRTVRRVVTRERLWNGNREPLTNLYRLDPEQNIVRWAWVTHPELVERYESMAADPAFAHLQVLRLRTPDDVEALFA